MGCEEPVVGPPLGRRLVVAGAAAPRSSEQAKGRDEATEGGAWRGIIREPSRKGGR